MWKASKKAWPISQDLKRRAKGFGRDADSLSILPGIRPIVGRDEAEVESRYQQAVELVTVEDAIVALGRPFNDHDFSKYPLDDTLPGTRRLGLQQPERRLRSHQATGQGRRPHAA